MATKRSSSPTLLFLFLFLLITTPQPSDSFAYYQCQTLFSLAQSLMMRVANLRASRGDLDGSVRARLIAEKLERGLGLGFRAVMWSMGWDFVKNYNWRDMASTELFGVVSDTNKLLRSLNELTQMGSKEERVAWVKQNYQNVLREFDSLFRRLLQVLRESEPLREVVETVQKEVVEGGLLWDCVELGSNDLKGLTQFFKDIALQYPSTNADGRDV